jgi:hypothetical protein
VRARSTDRRPLEEKRVDPVNKRRKGVEQPVRVAPDLVEYFIVTVPNPDSLSVVGTALADLVQASAIRILDLVLLVKDGEGAVTAAEPDAVPSLRHLAVDVTPMLSDHDIELAALALERESAAVILVTEDRWAEPLSVAARRAGGQIVAGERIPASRVASALAREPETGTKGE